MSVVSPSAYFELQAPLCYAVLPKYRSFGLGNPFLVLTLRIDVLLNGELRVLQFGGSHVLHTFYVRSSV